MPASPFHFHITLDIVREPRRRPTGIDWVTLIVLLAVLVVGCSAGVPAVTPDRSLAPVTIDGHGTGPSASFRLTEGDYQVAWRTADADGCAALSLGLVFAERLQRYASLVDEDELEPNKAGTSPFDVKFDDIYFIDANTDCDFWEARLVRVQ